MFFLQGEMEQADIPSTNVYGIMRGKAKIFWCSINSIQICNDQESCIQ